MIYLKKLSLTDDIVGIYNMLQEIALNENGFNNKVYGMSFDQFKQWLKKEYAVDNGNLEDWMVPQTSYWLYDDEKPVGYGRLRHRLNDKLAQTGGHIGYAVRSSERKKGYGNKLLSLLLVECEKIGFNKVQIGTNIDNIASNKIILNHGSTPADKQPDSIIVLVYADGKLVWQQLVTAANGWRYRFELPKYNAAGKEIVYTIDEVAVDGYDKTVDEYDLINTYRENTSENPDITPPTGDTIGIWLWMVLMFLSGTALLSLLAYKKYVGRRCKHEKK